MRAARQLLRVATVAGAAGWGFIAAAGTWSDTFSQGVLGSDWEGNREDFSISDGALRGNSAWPVAPSPFNRVEVGKGWSDYTVECRINVVEPNLRICTKGALVLRDSGTDGYVFALHVATGTIEVYRLSNEQMLLSKNAPLELKRWYQARAELLGSTMRFFVDGELIGTVTDERSASGKVGVAVQDAEVALFDDFVVKGPNIPGNGLELSVGEKLTLAWPRFLTNYVLVSTATLSPTAAWEVVTNTASLNGDLLSVTVDPTPGSRFYRLAPASP